MNEDILSLLENNAYDISTICRMLNNKFNLIDLTKTINSMIDENLLFEIDGVIYSFKNYSYGKVTYDHGRFLMEDDIEIIDGNNYLLNNGDEIIYKVVNGSGYCIKILKRKNVYVLGKIIYRHGKPYFFSDERRYADYKVSNIKSYSKIKPNYRVRCYISDYYKKELKIDTVLGPENSEEVLIKTILLMNEAPTDFSQTVLKETEELDGSVSIKGRHDLRNLSFITIDGDDAKDYDDAIYVEKNENGYKLYVSIADVSSYVKVDSALDRSAYSRGTSIYYPEHVIPMLPFRISDNLCSLMEGVDRYTITCEMDIGFDGLVSTYDIYPSVICSKHRMTYSKVNKILEHDKDLLVQYDDLKQMIYDSYELSRIVGNVRKSKGGIEFDSNEPLIVRKDGKVIDIQQRTQGKAEKLIEDFMIIANETVASHMFYLDLPCIYRNHTYPKEEKIFKFIGIAEELGYTFKGNKFELKSKELRKCLDHFENTEHYSLISDLMLHSMSKAIYESVSDIHYGLGLDHYCHFTSPIRRYPDLMVHRMLWKYCFDSQPKDVSKDLHNNITICKQCNETEKRATRIERDIDDLMMCEYLSDQIGKVFDAYICSTVEYGMYVRLDNTIEGLVHINTLDGYYYLDDKDNLTNGEIIYRIGQMIKVKLINIDLIKRNIDFEVYKKRDW